MMQMSAISMAVKKQTKIQKVTCTLPALRSEMAAHTGSTSWIAQG